MRFSLVRIILSAFFVSGLVGFGIVNPEIALTQQISPLVTGPVDEAIRTKLTGNVHLLARPEFDRGEAPDDLPLNRLVLVLRRPAQQASALESLIENQQNRNSPQFHYWLTPQQVGANFGPADSDLAAAADWLQSSGFTVIRISASRTFIEFSGNAGLVRQAFRTPIHRYIFRGKFYWANVQDPTVPAALAPLIAGVNSLNSFPRAAQNHFAGIRSIRGTRTSTDSPGYTYPGTDGTNYAVTPFDFATIYDLLPLWNASPAVRGTGETIAIVSRSDINPADATNFWTLFGLDGTHESEPTLVRTFDGPNPGKTSDESEADIDTQWSGAAAPGATINLVVSASTETTDGVDLSALYIVNNNLAPVMSDSYGACETSLGSSGVQFYGALWQQAAAQGISVFVASGDNGAAGCDDPAGPAKNGLNVNGLASTAFNVAVGGTDFNEYNTWSTYWNSTNDPVTSESAKGYIPETSWNDTCTNSLIQYLSSGTTNAETNCNNATFKALLNSTGGSGGASSSWTKPVWQTSTPSDNARDVPDVSLFASNGFLGSFYVICQSDLINEPCNLSNLAGFGGTSVASPAMAGIMALVDQNAGSAQGVPGLILYKLAAHQASAFHDVPAGTTNAVPCVTGSPNCTTLTAGDNYGVTTGYNTATGYDLVTGIGSVDAANLAKNWNTISFSPSTTTLSLNGGAAVSVVHGSSVPVAISVNPSAATGIAALMVSPGQPGPGIADFTLAGGAFSGSTTLLPGGSYNVMAHYAGDANYGGSYSNAVAVTVTPEGSVVLPNLVTIDVNGKITSRSASTATYGSGYQFFRVDVGDSTASVSSSGITSRCASHTASCPTGNVTLHASGTRLDGVVLPLNSEGYAEVQSLSPGTYTVVATYSGDASYAPSTATVNFAIAKAPTTATAGFSGTPVEYGNPEQIDAQIATTSDGIAPTGTFQFYVDGQAAGSPQPIYESSGYQPSNTATQWAWADAQTTYSFLTVGEHTLSASYSGDSNYAASTSPAINMNVSQAQTSFATWGWGTTSASIGQTVTATASLYGSARGVPPTGTITFTDNGTVIGQVSSFVSQGTEVTASLSYTFTTAGNHALTASYSGDANYLAAMTPSSNVLSVSGPFTASAGPITISSPGQPGATTVTLTPNEGFNGSVSLSCSPPAAAAESTCGFGTGTNSSTTLQVNVNGSATTVNFNVTTTAPHQAAALSTWQSSGLAYAVLLGLFAPVFYRRRRILLVLLTAMLLFSQTACGGGGNSSGSGGGSSDKTDPGTSPGTYNFTITASTGSGTTVFSTTTQVSVVVQ